MCLGTQGQSTCSNGFERTVLPALPGRCVAPRSSAQKVASWTAWSCRYHSDSATRKKVMKIKVQMHSEGRWGPEGWCFPHTQPSLCSPVQTPRVPVPWGLQEAGFILTRLSFLEECLLSTYSAQCMLLRAICVTSHLILPTTNGMGAPSFYLYQ